jgi:uncharacterized membrane protein
MASAGQMASSKELKPPPAEAELKPPPAEAQAAATAVQQDELTAKTFTLNILNGAVLSTVIALTPNAMLSELCKALLPVFPSSQFILDAINISTSMLSVIVGVLVGMMFKFTPIHIGSIALATVLRFRALTMGSGNG